MHNLKLSPPQVKARFASNKKKLEEKQKTYDFQQRVGDLREEEGGFFCHCSFQSDKASLISHLIPLFLQKA